MTDDETPQKEQDKRLSDSWSAGEPPDYGTYLFKPDELDLYANKLTAETYIFHGKKIDYEVIDHLVYNPDDFTVTVVRKDGKKMDLGIKMEWLVRPYIGRATEVSIVRTKDGVSLDGVIVPIVNTHAAKNKGG